MQRRSVDWLTMIVNERGQSLIQLLISIGLMGILMAAFASMMGAQQRQASQLGDKMARIDLERYISSVLADGSVCSYMLTNPAPSAFDPMNVGSGGGPAFPSYTNVPLKSDPASLSALTADGITPASPLSQSLVATSINVTDFQCATPCSPATDLYSANLTITYDSTKLSMPVAPTKFPITIKTTPSGGLQQVNGCTLNAGSMTPQQICTQLLGYTYNALTNPPCILTAPTTDQYTAICSIMGGSWTGTGCNLTLFGCTVNLVKNIRQTMDSMVALAFDEGFHPSFAYVDRLRELAGLKNAAELTRYIYFLVGVDMSNKVELVHFLRFPQEEENTRRRFISAAQANFHVDQRSAERLVALIAQNMRGDLNENL